MGRVSCDELERSQSDPSVVVVDVREEDRDWGFGHVEGSWHFPADSFDPQRLSHQLATHSPKCSHVVFYCVQSRSRAPMCAREFAASASESSLRVSVLAGGFDRWYEEGYPRCHCAGERCRRAAAVGPPAGAILVVRGRNGALVREGADKSADIVGTLERESLATVTGRVAVARDGTPRLEVASPIAGWVTARLLEMPKFSQEEVQAFCRSIVVGRLDYTRR